VALAGFEQATPRSYVIGWNIVDFDNRHGFVGVWCESLRVARWRVSSYFRVDSRISPHSSSRLDGRSGTKTNCFLDKSIKPIYLIIKSIRQSQGLGCDGKPEESLTANHSVNITLKGRSIFVSSESVKSVYLNYMVI
jgi:hypothetical protein